MVHGHHEVAVDLKGEEAFNRLELDKLNTGIAIVVPFAEIEKVVQGYNIKTHGVPLVW